MGLKVGIIGLPNVGKSTLFNAIMGRQAALTAPYPFATVKPNVGVVDVPDERLAKLHAALKSNPRSGVTAETPIVHTSITFVDIAGLVRGAAEGQGLGNQFLSHIRDVDVIVHVLREFEDPDVPRHQDSRDPQHDAEIVETELGLKDLEVMEKAGKKDKGDKKEKREEEEMLSKKPVVYAINVGEEKLAKFSEHSENSENQRSGSGGVPVLGFSESPTLRQSEFLEFSGRKKLIFCAKIEEQIAQLPKDEQQEFLAAYNLQESGLDRIIKQCYTLLELISFFTVGKIEVRAWPARQRFAAGDADRPIKIAPTAPQAAAVIHSDFEKLFIRGEIINWQTLCEAGSWQDAKEKGLVRTEGRDYIIQDGDVANFLIGK